MAPRSTKRAPNQVYRDRLELKDDFEVIQARISSTAERGRHVHDSERDPLRGSTRWTVGTEWAPPDDPELDLDENDEEYERAMGADMAKVIEDDGAMQGGQEEQASGGGKKKSEKAKRPHLFWKKNARDVYLDEMLRWEGRGEFASASTCPDCVLRKSDLPAEPVIRCLDCFLPDLTCEDCCIRRHQLSPFHTIEKWTGSTFVRSTLKDIGLVVHLNHASLRCPAPSTADSRLRVIHTNGIHDVAIKFCACPRAIPQHLQLLRRGLYPASQQLVRTCVTFALLRLLHLFTLTSKISTYDMYRALERLTADSSFKKPRSRYRPMMRSLIQWRHLKLLKRGGRGNDPSGVEGTRDGELAIPCPSCPIPGVNIPEDWHKAPVELLFLYSLVLCMDANFRLKNQLVSNYSTDPGLGIGWAYMVKREPYEAYVLSQADEEDISTCVGFQALAKATTRNSRGLRYTGVGAVVCGRSEMVLANGVGNLQKGERYANMDFLFASVLMKIELAFVAISYDIVCQWFINLFWRIKKCWPKTMRPRAGLFLRPLIPKFHAPAHNEKDHDQYDINLSDGMGMADCEAPERLWAAHNALSNSCKTTGPGTMHDVYDDNFGFWNWQKYTNMGASLLRRYKAAVSERNRQQEAHRGLTASLPAELISEWEEMCQKWHDDGFPKTQPSPYLTEGASLTEDEATADLEQQEAAALKESGSPALHKTSAVSCIAIGLDLEDSQRKLRELVAEQKHTPKNLQNSDVKQQREVLKSRIQDWEPIRAVYMPGLLQHLTDKGCSPDSSWDANPNPEDVDLCLPSSIAADARPSVCVEALPGIEATLRLAQCSSALHQLRQVLRLKTRMVYYKNKNVRGQREGTRSRAVIDRVHQRAIRLVHKYRHARSMKAMLDGPGDWQNTFRELRNEDVRGYESGRKKKGRGRVGIWEDGHEPPAANAEALLESDEESEIEMDDGTRQTDAQIRKALKKGTGETRKELSWIWTTATVSSQEDSQAADDILRSEWARSRARSKRASEEVTLLLEEMRRVLAFLEWKAEWWDARETLRVVEDDALAEGIAAFAESQASVQRALSASFRLLWKTPLRDVDTRTNEGVEGEARQEDTEGDSNVRNDTAANENDPADSDEDSDNDEEVIIP